MRGSLGLKPGFNGKWLQRHLLVLWGRYRGGRVGGFRELSFPLLPLLSLLQRMWEDGELYAFVCHIRVKTLVCGCDRGKSKLFHNLLIHGLVLWSCDVRRPASCHLQFFLWLFILNVTIADHAVYVLLTFMFVHSGDFENIKRKWMAPQRSSALIISQLQHLNCIYGCIWTQHQWWGSAGCDTKEVSSDDSKLCFWGSGLMVNLLLWRFRVNSDLFQPVLGNMINLDEIVKFDFELLRSLLQTTKVL